MNCLDVKTRSLIIGCLIEGCSVRATVRMTGVAKVPLLGCWARLVALVPRITTIMSATSGFVSLQCDEIWQFVGSKDEEHHIEKKQEGWGDIWTWIGIDADTKLVVGYLVGGRDGGWAKEFMEDCASRIRGRVQVTTDGHKAYLDAVEGAFGMDVDYAQLQKIYGAPTDAERAAIPPPVHWLRYEGCERKSDPKHVNIFRGAPEPNAPHEQPALYPPDKRIQ